MSFIVCALIPLYQACAISARARFLVFKKRESCFVSVYLIKSKTLTSDLAVRPCFIHNQSASLFPSQEVACTVVPTLLVCFCASKDKLTCVAVYYERLQCSMSVIQQKKRQTKQATTPNTYSKTMQRTKRNTGEGICIYVATKTYSKARGRSVRDAIEPRTMQSRGRHCS